MSLGCGEGREYILSGFSLVYCIGSREEGFTLPNKERNIFPPHAAVCDEHLKKILEKAYRDSFLGVRGRVYAVVRGGGWETLFGLGYSLFGVSPANSNFKFLTRRDMKEYLPRALDIIDAIKDW